MGNDCICKENYGGAQGGGDILSTAVKGIAGAVTQSIFTCRRCDRRVCKQCYSDTKCTNSKHHVREICTTCQKDIHTFTAYTTCRTCSKVICRGNTCNLCAYECSRCKFSFCEFHILNHNRECDTEFDSNEIYMDYCLKHRKERDRSCKRWIRKNQQYQALNSHLQNSGIVSKSKKEVNESKDEEKEAPKVSDRKNEESEEPKIPECTICMEKEISVALAPCGHVMCHGCASRLRTNMCPYCRQKNIKIIRLFFPGI